ncbi:MAG: hydantoinase B/oxoprolinase family protein [Alphaproteobacteria bacterium]|nr:hydantoinase B/oxoprolinase family protein [Alphaproteobacteria bacterium]
MVAPEVPNNAGSLAPITVSAPDGCLLNAKRPRALADGFVSRDLTIPAVWTTGSQGMRSVSRRIIIIAAGKLP